MDEKLDYREHYGLQLLIEPCLYSLYKSVQLRLQPQQFLIQPWKKLLHRVNFSGPLHLQIKRIFMDQQGEGSLEENLVEKLILMLDEKLMGLLGLDTRFDEKLLGMETRL